MNASTSNKVSNVSTEADCYFIILGSTALPGGPAMRCEEPVSTAANVWLSDQRPGFDSRAPGRPP